MGKEESRMNDDRLPLRTLFGRIGGRIPWGRPHKTWIQYAREDLRYLSECTGCLGRKSVAGCCADIRSPGQQLVSSLKWISTTLSC
jgi:hypothetical protein